MRLKSNCYRLHDEDEEYFLKTYEKAYVLKKVKAIHEALCAEGFPYVHPAIIDLNKGHFRQRWVEGTVANYRSASHRKQVYEMLKALHATNKQIDWQSKGFSILNLKKKWRARLAKFQLCEPSIRPFLQQDFDLICHWAEEALSEMEPIYSEEQPTLLHGDVVHHNFFVGEEPLMIDFDLAIVGPAIYEEMMFVQRVLPMIRYDWLQLLQELPALRKLEPYSAYLRFPNELLREWCYFAMGDEAQRGKLYFYVRNLTSEAKRYRSSFLHQLQISNP